MSNTFNQIGRILVFVRPELDNGPILMAEGAFLEELSNCGWDLTDHNLPQSTHMGLQIFEGKMVYTTGPEPDTYFAGKYRDLTHWEMMRLIHHMVPWDIK